MSLSHWSSHCQLYIRHIVRDQLHAQLPFETLTLSLISKRTQGQNRTEKHRDFVFLFVLPSQSCSLPFNLVLVCVELIPWGGRGTLQWMFCFNGWGGSQWKSRSFLEPFLPCVVWWLWSFGSKITNIFLLPLKPFISWGSSFSYTSSQSKRPALVYIYLNNSQFWFVFFKIILITVIDCISVLWFLGLKRV